jgi:hypothetical protein
MYKRSFMQSPGRHQFEVFFELAGPGAGMRLLQAVHLYVHRDEVTVACMCVCILHVYVYVYLYACVLLHVYVYYYM